MKAKSKTTKKKKNVGVNRLPDGRPVMGRPKKTVDEALIENLAQIMCTEEEIAYVTGTSATWLLNWAKKRYRMTFDEFMKMNQAKGKASLRRKQMSVALEGSEVMLIWMGKQHLAQRDFSDYNVKAEVKQLTIFGQLSDAELDTELEKIEAAVGVRKRRSTSAKERSKIVAKEGEAASQYPDLTNEPVDFGDVE